MTTWIRRGAILTVLALVVAALAIYMSTRTQTVQADDDGSVEGLTGRALGEELGLEPVTWDDVKGDCWAFAEYDDDHNGFCMDSVVSTKTEAALLGRQINGHLLSDAERRFIELSFKLNDLEDSGQGDQAQIDQLSDQVWQLQQSLN